MNFSPFEPLPVYSHNSIEFSLATVLTALIWHR